MIRTLFNTSKDTKTENGDPSHSTTKSALLDFFTGMCRDDKTLSKELEAQIPAALDACWKENPELTLKMIFYKRDCRGGAGERKIFETSYRWLYAKNPKLAFMMLVHIPEYGSWKDMVKLTDLPFRSEIMGVFAKQLQADLKVLSEKDDDKKDEKFEIVNPSTVSIAAKWAPTIDSSLDRKYGIAKLLANQMNITGLWQRDYRVKVLKPLRDHLQILEKHMSLGEWQKVNFAHVPSLAMAKNKDVLKKHDPERYQKWLSDVKKGTSKVNAGQMMPHQLLSSDPTSVAQWNALREKTRKLGKFTRCLAIPDVSGSMHGLPMDVSCALAILISECAAPPFNDLVISFSERPHFVELTKDETPLVKSQQIRADGGLSTDLVKVFRVLLQKAMMEKIPPNEMPEKLFIISDMEFDAAAPDYDLSSHEVIKQLYRQSGYALPQIVFWNVAGNLKSFPVQKTELGVAAVSGFSPSILKVLLDGDIPDPMTIMMKTLQSDRYARISLKDQILL